jgi:1,4-dihydroxy-2-naphthoyl-CoA hydrolase
VPETPEPAALAQLMPYAVELGIEIQEASPERAAGSLAWSPELCTGGGVMHGGAILSLADSVGAICAFMNLPDGAGTTTIESKTNFLRAVRGGHIRATSEPLHVGRTVIVVQTRIEDDDERLVAQTTQTQAVLGGSGR